MTCQDISGAGLGAGIKGARSGLWKEFFRIIEEIRPKMVLIENVAMLRSRGLDVVLNDLWSIGYHAEWDIIPAAAVGAPHLRERIWIVARPAELASDPVYGEVAVDRKGESKTFSFLGKLPRAGRMDAEDLHELVPIAPRKTKREDGWSWWTGVNLFDGESTPRMWPTAVTTDSKATRNETARRTNPDSKHHSGRTLLDAIEIDVREIAMVPTPCAHDDNKSPEAHMHMKETKMPGGPRKTITSLQVLAKNEFKQANGMLWATATDHPRTHTPRQVDHGQQLANQVDEVGNALWPTSTGRDYKDTGDLNCVPEKSLLPRRVFHVDQGTKTWPTSDGSGGPGTSAYRTGGENLRTAVATKTPGSLNPSWTEWLMGMPLWWTDPTVPNELVTQVSWSDEPLHVAARVAEKIPLRPARLTAIGNSVVWQCAYVALSRALEATPAMTEDLEMAA